MTDKDIYEIITSGEIESIAKPNNDFNFMVLREVPLGFLTETELEMKYEMVKAKLQNKQ